MNVRPIAGLVVAGILMAGFAVPRAAAQTAQPWSLQPSFLTSGQDLGDSVIPGFGFEGQLRYTPAALWSVGVGVQYTAHSSDGETIEISGVFLEPRYTVDIGSDRVAPYLAGRLALLRQSASLVGAGDVSSTGSGFGAGAGLLVRLAPTVNLDLGGALLSQGFNDADGDGGSVVQFDRFLNYVVKGGFSWGFGTR